MLPFESILLCQFIRGVFLFLSFFLLFRIGQQIAANNFPVQPVEESLLVRMWKTERRGALLGFRAMPLAGRRESGWLLPNNGPLAVCAGRNSSSSSALVPRLGPPNDLQVYHFSGFPLPLVEEPFLFSLFENGR